LNSQAELRELAIGLTNNETHFFRDTGQFRILEAKLLPSLLEEKLTSKTLRIWSAGCASGEEAYSIAIVLQILSRHLKDWKIDILGTDINDVALSQARGGAYASWSFRVISPERKAAFFEYSRGHWNLKSEIREMVRFSRLDLIQDGFPSLESGIHEMDLILCRNVFIYFEPRIIGQVLDKLKSALRPGGYLLTAHGELHGQDLSRLEVLSFPDSTVYQRTRQVSGRKQKDVALADVPPSFDQVDQPGNHLSTVEKGTEAAAKVKEFARMARNCANEGRHEAAEEWCQRALVDDPFAVEIYYLLAKIAEERKDRERAKEMLKRVLYLDPDCIAAHIDLSELYESEGDLKRARKLQRSVLHCLRRLKGDTWIDSHSATAAELILAIEARMACSLRS
jgi:chemotaxis protein methyltransferase CheR